jgi:hypothetical protein
MRLDDGSMGPLSKICVDPAVHILDQKFAEFDCLMLARNHDRDSF